VLIAGGCGDRADRGQGRGPLLRDTAGGIGPPRPPEGEIAGERDHRERVDDQRRDQEVVAEMA
jgi:hypothetical protein